MVYLAHTHDGARVAMYCLWHGTPKVRVSQELHFQSPWGLALLCTALSLQSCTSRPQRNRLLFELLVASLLESSSLKTLCCHCMGRDLSSSLLLSFQCISVLQKADTLLQKCLGWNTGAAFILLVYPPYFICSYTSQYTLCLALL